MLIISWFTHQIKLSWLGSVIEVDAKRDDLWRSSSQRRNAGELVQRHSGSQIFCANFDLRHVILTEIVQNQLWINLNE